MLYSARQTWERIVYRVLGHGRMADVLGFYIGPFAALAGILLLVSIVLYIKKKHTPAIVTGILSVLCALIWKFAWIDYYYRSSATWLPVIVVVAVVGFIMFKREKTSNHGETEQTRLELERLRLEKERLELELLRRERGNDTAGQSADPAPEDDQRREASEEDAPRRSHDRPSQFNQLPDKPQSTFWKRPVLLVLAVALGIGAFFGVRGMIQAPSKQYPEMQFPVITAQTTAVTTQAPVMPLPTTVAATQAPAMAIQATATATQVPAAAVQAPAKVIVTSADQEQARHAQSFGPFYDGRAYFKGQNGEYGYVNEEGQVIVPPVYDDAESFENGYACVTQNGKKGFLNTSGELVIPCMYDYASYLNDVNLFCVETGKNRILLNSEGKQIGPQSQSYISFSDGLASVYTEGKGTGFIDTSGTLVIPYHLNWSSGSFKDGVCSIVITENNTKTYATIDRQGNILNSFVMETKYQYPMYDEAMGVYYAAVSLSDGNKKLVALDGKTGQVVREAFALIDGKKTELHVSDRPDDISAEDYLPVQMWNWESNYQVTHTMVYLYAPTLGMIIFPPSNDHWMSASSFRNGYAVVRTCAVDRQGIMDTSKAGSYGLINVHGEYVISPRYDSLQYLTEGFYKFKSGNQWGIVDTSGKVIVSASYDAIGSWDGGSVRVKKNGYYGFLGSNLNVQIPIQYEDAARFSSDSSVTAVQKNGSWYLINRKGKTISELN